jgi:hypothetical protein
MARRPVNLETMLEEENVQRDLQEIKYTEPTDVYEEDAELGLPEAPEVEPTPQQDEPILVAGRITEGAQWLAKKLGDRVAEAEKRATAQGPQPTTKQVGAETVLRQAEPEEEAAILDSLGMAEQYTKGLNFPKIAEATGEIDLSVYLQGVKDGNPELFEQARRGTLSFEALQDAAEKQGFGAKIIQFMKRKPGDPAVAEDVLAGLMAAKGITLEVQKLIGRGRAATDEATRKSMYEQAAKLIQAETILYSNISGAVSESGRVLMASREAQKLGIGATRSDELLSLIDRGQLMDYEHFFDAYMALPDDAARANFTKRTWAREKLDQGVNFVTEGFINSILSSPVTHMVNMGGNSGFMLYKGVEEVVAGGVGLVRTTIPGTKKDRVFLREGLTQMAGIFSGFTDAMLVAGKAGIRGTPADKASKVELQNRRSFGTTDDLSEIGNQIKQGNFGTAAINVLGVYYRASSRALIVEDEFFKAIAYQASIKKQAYVRSLAMFDATLARTGSVAEAKKAEALEYANLLENPPSPMKLTAEDAARELTFQGDLGTFLGAGEGVANLPLVKLFGIPFYKTPTNVMKETFRRTPFAAGHAFYDMVAKGGRDADMAIARVGLGTLVMSSFGHYALSVDDPSNNLIIVGSGPTDPQARQAMERLGIQPFSMNFKQDDGTYKSVTYSRFDPISGMLGMAADAAYYAQYEDDPNMIANIYGYGALTAFDYALEQPFLQGVADITNIVSMASTDPKAGFDMAQRFFSERATTAVMSTLPTVSSAMATYERYESPAGSETSKMMERWGDPDTMPQYQQGFYMALQKAMARNPYFSDEVPPKLNLWGETVMQGKGYVYETFSPVRIKDAKYEGIDRELMRLNDGIAMPNRKMGHVTMTAEEYNRFITLTNTMDYMGNMPDDPDYNEDNTLLPQLEELIYSDDYINERFDDVRLSEIKRIVRSFREMARDRLLSADEHPELGSKIDAARMKRRGN